MVQKARKILRDKNLPDNYQPYVDLRNSLSKNTGYIGTFTHFLVDGKSNDELTNSSGVMTNRVDELKKVYSQILEMKDLLPLLGKNVIDYEKLDDLKSDISDLKNRSEVKKFIEELPTIQRAFMYDNGSFKRYEVPQNMSNHRVKKISSGKIVYYLECEKYIRHILSETTAVQRKSFFKNVSAYRTLNDFLYKLNNLKYLPTLDGVIRQAKSTKNCIITHIDREKGILVIQVLDYNSCRILGASSSWCISRDPQHFKNYIRKGKQFIIYNIESQDDRYKLIGITTNSRGRVLDCFDKWNYECTEFLRNTYRYQNTITHLFNFGNPVRPSRSKIRFKRTIINRNLSSSIYNEGLFGILDKYSISRFINYIIDIY